MSNFEPSPMIFSQRINRTLMKVGIAFTLIFAVMCVLGMLAGYADNQVLKVAQEVVRNGCTATQIDRTRFTATYHYGCPNGFKYELPTEATRFVQHYPTPTAPH